MLTAFTPVTIDPSYVIALLLVAFHASNRFNPENCPLTNEPSAVLVKRRRVCCLLDWRLHAACLGRAAQLVSGARAADG